MVDTKVAERTSWPGVCLPDEQFYQMSLIGHVCAVTKNMTLRLYDSEEYTVDPSQFDLTQRRR